MTGGGDFRDRLLFIVSTLSAGVVVAMFAWIVFSVARQGSAHLSWSFLLSAPADSGRIGGIGPILVSTAAILCVALAVAVPVGLATALLLSESLARAKRYHGLLRTSLDVLAGTPSIVFGLFGNAFFCVYLGLGFSILSGGLTLACMILPLLVRTVEASLRSVPQAWWAGAAAVGMSRTATLRALVLPSAAPAIMAGVMLGLGRAMAETAALLFTSGYVDRMPSSLLDSGRSLSVHIHDLSMNVVGGTEAAYASAIVLMATLLLTHACARWLAARWMHARVTAS